MTRCVKGSEFSHLELSMLWAGKLIHHVMPTSLANAYGVLCIDLVPSAMKLSITESHG